jgi:hypothetical protein
MTITLRIGLLSPEVMEKEAIRSSVGRWLKWSVISFTVFSFFVVTHGFYAGKFQRVTGEAEWIWTWNRLSRQNPAVFFAARNFHLPPDRQYVRIKIAADPMYTLFFNEVEIGGARWREQEAIDVYDVSDLAVEGVNRIVVAVRGPDGVGGLIAAVDTAPLRQNIVVTDQQWRIVDHWSSEHLRSLPEGAAMVPRLLGRPPVGRWNFPAVQRGIRYEAGGYLLQPVERTEIDAALRVVNVIGGVAVAGREEVEATVFDFRNVEGRPRIRMSPGPTRVVRYRTIWRMTELADESEPHRLVVAEGETWVTEPSTRSFRYFVAFDPIEDVEVLSERP